MKKVIIILCILGFYHICVAQDISKNIIDYQTELDKCDKSYDNEASQAKSTSEMIKSIYNADNCYKNIAYNIIEQQYKKNSAKHKQALDNYIQTSYTLTGLIYETADICGTGCGSMGTVMAKNNTATQTRNIVKSYLRALGAMKD